MSLKIYDFWQFDKQAGTHNLKENLRPQEE